MFFISRSGAREATQRKHPKLPTPTKMPKRWRREELLFLPVVYVCCMNNISALCSQNTPNHDCTASASSGPRADVSTHGWRYKSALQPRLRLVAGHELGRGRASVRCRPRERDEHAQATLHGECWGGGEEGERTGGEKVHNNECLKRRSRDDSPLLSRRVPVCSSPVRRNASSARVSVHLVMSSQLSSCYFAFLLTRSHRARHLFLIFFLALLPAPQNFSNGQNHTTPPFSPSIIARIFLARSRSLHPHDTTTRRHDTTRHATPRHD